jgi:hypothetical protein
LLPLSSRGIENDDKAGSTVEHVPGGGVHYRPLGGYFLKPPQIFFRGKGFKPLVDAEKDTPKWKLFKPD